MMDFTPEQWGRLSQLFDEAAVLPLPGREALIERVRRQEGDAMAGILTRFLKSFDEASKNTIQSFRVPISSNSLLRWFVV
jgi:hypothetical protein